MVFCLRHNALYLGGHSAQTVHPLSKLAYKRHILGMSTSLRKWFLSPEIVTFELCAGSKHPTQNTASGSSFLRFAKPLRRNLEIFHRCMLRHIDSCLLFQTSSTSVQDKCPKGRIVLVTEKKTRLGTVWRNPWGDFPQLLMQVCTVVPHFYSWLHTNPFRLGEVITEKHFCDL